MTKITGLVALLNDFKNSSFFIPENEHAYQEIVAFINTYPETCFDRTLLVGHVTGSAFVVNHNFSKCLMMHHEKLDMWVQFGGHADGDSDIAAVAAREAHEESGIEGLKFVVPGIFDIDVHMIPERNHEPEHNHYDIRFFMVVPEGVNFVQNEESLELRWVTYDELKELTNHPSVLRMADKWMEYKIF